MKYYVGQPDDHMGVSFIDCCKRMPTLGRSSVTFPYCTRPMGHGGRHSAISGSFDRGGRLTAVWDDAGVAYQSINYDYDESMTFGVEEGRW